MKMHVNRIKEIENIVVSLIENFAMSTMYTCMTNVSQYVIHVAIYTFITK